MKVAFFTEADPDVGAGHLIRNYAVYEKFKEKGNNCDFFLCSKYRYYYGDLQYIYFDNWKEIKKIHIKQYDIIFIDSYKASIENYEILCKNSKICVFFDDYGRLNYPKGVVINFSPDAEKLFSRKKSGYYYLLGTKFIPLRSFFKKNCGIDAKNKNEKKHIFLMIGSSDIKNITLDIIRELENMNQKKVVVTMNPSIEKKIREIHLNNVQVLYMPNDEALIKNMINSKIAIITASMASYELSCLGIPTLALIVSKDQRIGAPILKKHKIIKDFIDIENPGWLDKLKKEIEKSLRNRRKILQDPQIDGQGVDRIYDRVVDIWKKC